MLSTLRLVAATLSLSTSIFAAPAQDPALGPPSKAFGFQPPSSLAPASSWSDNFDRANAGTLGVDWVVQAGLQGIINNTGYGISGLATWAQHATASIPYANARVTIDFLPPVSGSSLVYVATLLGTGLNTSSVFMKVQDNNSSGDYDVIWFYRGVHGAGGAWSTGASSATITPTVSGRMTCYMTNAGDTANCDIDNNFDGIVDNHTERSGVLAWGVALGSGIGLGTGNSPAFDNWSASDGSGPPPPIAYCTSSTTAHGCNASMSATGTASIAATSGFVMTAANVEGLANGVFFYGTLGRVAVPWAAGSTSFLCVKFPLQRSTLQNSGGNFGACDGTLALDFLAFMAANPTALGQPITAGQSYNAQAWFRDPPSPKGTSLSDGLEFTLVP